MELVPCLKDFFQTYLREQRAVSPNTIKSYRDTFKLLVRCLISKRRSARVLNVEDLDVRTILAFLQSLEDSANGRGNCARTRNQRLAAIQSFFKYLALFHPNLERQAQRILAIPMKNAHPKIVEFLNTKELETLLAQPSMATADGVRDLAILTFLYNTGARAQEVADAQISWFDFSERTVSITGKGNKTRLTPLWPPTVRLLKLYLGDCRRKPRPLASDRFFINQRGGVFTRFGIWSIVKKHLKLAAKKCPSLAAKRLSTHSLRHTTAVHLLESRVEPNVIKAWLGHASVKSTNPYLDTDLTHKRRILEQFAPPNYVESILEPKAQMGPDKILDFLKDL